MEPFGTSERRAPTRSGPLHRPPTPAQRGSLHPKMVSRDGVLVGLLRSHGVPSAAPAQTGTECQYVLPRQALAELYDELRKLLERYPS